MIPAVRISLPLPLFLDLLFFPGYARFKHVHEPVNGGVQFKIMFLDMDGMTPPEINRRFGGKVLFFGKLYQKIDDHVFGIVNAGDLPVNIFPGIILHGKMDSFHFDIHDSLLMRFLRNRRRGPRIFNSPN
jgi:hypothetical protein